MKGLREVSTNLNKALAKIGELTKDGLEEAALFVEGESIEMTPVDFGVLRNSTFTEVEMVGNSLRARIGYTAKYAPWVHEMPMKLKGQPRADFGRTRDGINFGGGSGKGRYWDGGENKFLEKAIKFNHKEIVSIIADSAKKAAK